MMDLESETREILVKNTVDKEKDGGKVHADLEEKSKSNFTSGEKFGVGGKDLDAGKDGGCDILFESGVVSESDSSRNQCQNDGVLNLVNKVGDDACNRKRKRECMSILRALNWVKNVAKDPCHQVIGTLPELSKWKYFGTEQPWKQLMLIRQELMVKRNDNSSVVENIWLKKKKMHPAMYEDHSVRCSQRIISAKISQAVLSSEKLQAQLCSKSTSSNTQSDLKLDSPKIVRVGIYYQAEVPEWTEEASDSDSKWLGIRIWPQDEGVNRNCLIERDPTGFGRRDSCGCEFKGSSECVRYHVSERRITLKLELGVAFYQWHIDKMGEEVASSWNKAEELNFEAIVRSNLPSQGKCFWKGLRKYFHNKKWEELVSYYFNVFLLRRRGTQNRSTIPMEISSDKDD